MKLCRGVKSLLLNGQAAGLSRSLHSSSSALATDQTKFSDKPMRFKKFKIKQAQMQKDDDAPVYLKKGLPDKLLFNFTLGLFFYSSLLAVKSLINLDKIDKK